MNVKSLMLVLVLLSAWSPALAQDDGLTEKFRRLEIDLMTAVKDHDRTGMETLLSPDYKLTSSDSSGALVSRQGYIAGSMNPDYLQAEEFKFLDLQAEPITADVVLVRSKLYWASRFRGRPWKANFLMSDIWRKEEGVWRLVARHSSYPADELPRIVAERYSEN